MKTIVESADFYLGRGPTAEHLGSVLDAGAPEDFDPWDRFQSRTDENYTAQDFRDEVGDLLATHAACAYRTDARGWPWEYVSSVDTPWAYVYDAGTVYVYRYGVEMAAIRCNYTRPGPHGEREPRRPQSATPVFPNLGIPHHATATNRSTHR